MTQRTIPVKVLPCKENPGRYQFRRKDGKYYNHGRKWLDSIEPDGWKNPDPTGMRCLMIAVDSFEEVEVMLVNEGDSARQEWRVVDSDLCTLSFLSNGKICYKSYGDVFSQKRWCEHLCAIHGFKIVPEFTKKEKPKQLTSTLEELERQHLLALTRLETMEARLRKLEEARLRQLEGK